MDGRIRDNRKHPFQATPNNCRRLCRAVSRSTSRDNIMLNGPSPSTAPHPLGPSNTYFPPVKAKCQSIRIVILVAFLRLSYCLLFYHRVLQVGGEHISCRLAACPGADKCSRVVRARNILHEQNRVQSYHSIVVPVWRVAGC